MRKVSRRQLARTLAQQLQDGVSRELVLQKAAAYLVAHNMTKQADMLVNDISTELASISGRVSAVITTAHTLSVDSCKELERYVASALHAKSVDLSVIEDPSIIGGVIIRTPEYEYDASVRRILNLLAK